MRKKKICVLHASVPFVYGGAELMIKALVKNLIERGYDTELVQIPYKWYPAHSLYDNLLMWRLLDIQEANNEKVDLVIGTKFPSYGAIHPNKVAWVIHQYRQAYDLFETPEGLNGNPEGETIRSTIKKYDEMCLNECKKIFTISQNVSDRLAKYNNICSTPLYHPPILSGRYYTEKYEKYILSVGRLDRLKRNDLLIKSLPYCDKEITVKIAGRGPELENLQHLAKKLNVEERVAFLGFVSDEDLLGLYANAGAVYYAPLDEDYGYVTLEAFLSSKPVLTCCDSGGVLEFVKDNLNGYVCECKEQDIAQGIQKLYRIPARLSDFGHNGYEAVKDISWDIVIDALTQTLR